MPTLQKLLRKQATLREAAYAYGTAAPNGVYVFVAPDFQSVSVACALAQGNLHIWDAPGNARYNYGIICFLVFPNINLS
ncbi:MAG: hypothetical protein ACREPR_08445 [Brasilonema sp.]